MRIEGSAYWQIVRRIADAYETDADILGAEWPREYYLGDVSGTADAFATEEEVERALDAWDVLAERYIAYSRIVRSLAAAPSSDDPLRAAIHAGVRSTVADANLSAEARAFFRTAPENDVQCRECALVWDYADLDDVWNPEERLEEAPDLTDPPGDCPSCGGLATSLRPLDRRGAVYILAEGVLDPWTGERYAIRVSAELREMLPTLLADAPGDLRRALFGLMGQRGPRTN